MALVKKLKKSLGRSDELKAFGLENKYKRALFNVLRNEESLSIVVNISKVYPSILASSKSICRYKDYVMKRGIKEKLRQLIDKGIIDSTQDIKINVSVDEQLTSTDGIYSLAETIKEELQHGILNYDYGAFHKPIFSANVEVSVKYCESKNNYIIQASDILANRIFTSYRDNKPGMRAIKNHINLTFP